MASTPKSSDPVTPAEPSPGPTANDDQAVDELEEGSPEDDLMAKAKDPDGEHDALALNPRPNRFTAPSAKSTSTLASLGGGHGGRTQATFVRKLYTMIEDAPEPSAEDPSPPMPLIAWSRNGETFVVHNLTEFSGVVLPQYFKHNNWQSFVRQLNMYGFHKVNDILSGASPSVDNPAQAWEFQHPSFRRGRPDLFQHIKRKTAKPAGPAGAGSDHHLHQLQQPMLAPYLQPAPPPPPPQPSSSASAYPHSRSQHAQPAAPSAGPAEPASDAAPLPLNRASMSSSAGSSAASNGGRPRSAHPPAATTGYPTGRPPQTGPASHPADTYPPPASTSTDLAPPPRPPVPHQPHFGAGVPAHGWPQPPPQRRDWHAGPDHVSAPPPPPPRQHSHHPSSNAYHPHQQGPSLGEEFEALHRRLDHLAEAFYRSRQDTIVGKRDTAVVLKTILDVLSGIVEDPARAAREIEAGASEKYRGGVALAQDAITKLEMQAKADADALSQSDRPRSSSGYTRSHHAPLHHHHHPQTGYYPPSTGTSTSAPAHRSSAVEASPQTSPAIDHPIPNGSVPTVPRSSSTSFPRPPTANPPSSSSTSSSMRKHSLAGNPIQRGEWGPTLPTPHGPSPVAVSAWIPPRAPSVDQVKREGGSPGSKELFSGGSTGKGGEARGGNGTPGGAAGGGGGAGGSGRMGGGVQLPPLSALLRGPEESFERAYTAHGSGLEAEERASKRTRYGTER